MTLKLIEQSPLVLGAGDLWREGTTADFLSAIGDGNLPSEAFHRWLVQDYAFAKGLAAFQAVAVARTPRPAQKVLIAGLGALDVELDWFEQKARQYELDLSAAIHPTCSRYVDYLVAAAYTQPVEVLKPILFGVEAAYLSAWSSLEATGPYAEFIQRWTNPLFVKYVTKLLGICDREPDEIQQRQFNEVLQHERDFWRMTWEG
ncbi:thiaminase II/PqqC family protein [Crateriforma conspicua]|uniref:Multifunctional thiamine-phosphate pyrophosphorylase/synthase/phosphomethylpyrimidine kinase n=1 Tax=Crateriforma conspicua TaxID=2527996 RepID=A0A5C5XQF7_9PLAN|nr:TenA family transcriptional regulator [Crateriforma conspicua]TWT65456.1 multifunctional thiamine-phosphate pyrophosphorylase/synthase/phosphomethylpyrimidine kinase [Crateriforma conspicua]